MPPVGAALWRSLRTFQIYGANTEVGKTVVSAILCKAARAYRPQEKVSFLKPVSTGSLQQADDRHISRFIHGISTNCLYQFDEPVSPHLAAQHRSRPRDEEILGAVRSTLSVWAQEAQECPGKRALALLETAGGVHSPGPNGTSQADLYRPLRLPVILIADSRLGGISSTISAFESLLVRGYDVEGVVTFREEYYKNYEYLGQYFGRRDVPLLSVPPPPPKRSPGFESKEDMNKDRQALSAYYDNAISQPSVGEFMSLLEKRHDARIERLESMATRAHEVMWYPFTQHQGTTASDITVIDSAHDDYFQTLKPTSASRPGEDDAGLMQPTFDGSASWWTQGLGHANPELSLTAAYAAGRYGHVMFAGTVHEPALALAELLLKTVDNPRLTKVFYTDNGSTGMEVAIKMGLRAACDRYGWDASSEDINIIGLKGSYHGDTMGVMDCSEPSTYNKRVEWYRGRGFWFDFPIIRLSRGKWIVEMPWDVNGALGSSLEFSTLNDIFDLEKRRASGASELYESYIKSTLEDLVLRQGKKFGALIIEPVVLGAGGMLFADPLFQQTLVRVIRENPQLFGQGQNLPDSTSATAGSWSGLPVIFDEVFTGLYRLGRASSGSFLDVQPDIAVYAKLLTGGLIPLCVTLASNSIFEAFSSPHKADALLHGHSYTAHAMGCQVAHTSIKTMADMERNQRWTAMKKDWVPSPNLLSPEVSSVVEPNPSTWSMWSRDFVHAVSRAESVEGVFALGCVLSIRLRDETGGGYTSTAAKSLQQQLSTTSQGFNVHSRVLGNVIYFMASLTSKPDTLRTMERLLSESLLPLPQQTLESGWIRGPLETPQPEPSPTPLQFPFEEPAIVREYMTVKAAS